MPYVGNTPLAQFTDVKYQDLTGGTGTGFTLDYAVSNANAIEVYVNNVRQEPCVAYTATGTTLTMTGDIVADDDFYVVFSGIAITTATHPETSNLKAASGQFTGIVEITGNTPFYESTNTISTNHTIPSNRNAVAIGPVTISAEVTVNGNLTIV